MSGTRVMMVDGVDRRWRLCPQLEAWQREGAVVIAATLPKAMVRAGAAASDLLARLLIAFGEVEVDGAHAGVGAVPSRSVCVVEVDGARFRWMVPGFVP